MNKPISSFNTRSIVPAVLGAVAAVLFVSVVAWAATTIGTNVNTGGTLTVSGASTLTGTTTSAGAIYASSTVLVDGILETTRNNNLGAASQTPTVTGLNLTGDGYVTSGLGVGYATTSDGNLLVTELASFNSRVGVSATNSPTVDFGVDGSGLFSGGLGVGYATTGSGHLLVSGLAVIQSTGRLGVGSTSPSTQFDVTGSGYVSSGFGVGTATTSAGGLQTTGMGVFGNGIDVRGANATSTFGAGALGLTASATPYLEVGIAGDVAIGGALGTSTLSLETTTSAKGGCIELRGVDGTWVSIYPGGGATSAVSVSQVITTGRALITFALGRCQGGNE